MAEKQEAAIVVDGLRKTFGDFVAVDNVSFEVPAGTVFGLLGPNGAGKTTTVRILATVLGADAGRATIMGYDVMKQRTQVRYQIGLAGQAAAVDGNLTGRENLELIGRLAQMYPGAVNRRSQELLESFRLTGAADRPVKGYSGGMRRRLDIAAALIFRPPVLFLDEPTTGLDPHSRNELWEAIKNLVDDGTTVLLTTQYLEEADVLADRIAVIDHGQVIVNDTPERLKQQFGAATVELTYPDSAAADAAFATVPDEGSLTLRGAELQVNAAEPVQVLATLLPSLAASNRLPEHLTVREPSLDSVFLALTGQGKDDGDSDSGKKKKRRNKREQKSAEPTSGGDAA